MNKIFYIALFMITCAFSCSKQKDNGSMTATVNGGSWVADEWLGTKTADGITIQGTLHYSSGDYSNIAIYFPKGYPAGTYDLSAAHASYIPHNYSSTILLSVYGTASIISVSPNVMGTFSFTCSDSTKVEQGTFSVKTP